MKRTVDIPKEVVAALMQGKRPDGRLILQEASKGKLEIVFRQFNRSKRVRMKDQLIKMLEHGWVKESVNNIKIYDSLPKKLGLARILEILDRELNEAKNGLIDREIIDRV